MPFFVFQFSPTKSFYRQLSSQDALHRSNSSLELMHDPNHYTESALRREYGSHGSIDVIGNGKKWFFFFKLFSTLVFFLLPFGWYLCTTV